MHSLLLIHSIFAILLQLCQSQLEKNENGKSSICTVNRAEQIRKSQISESLKHGLVAAMGCAGSVVGIFQSSMVIDRDHFFFTKVMGSGGFGTVVSAIHIEHHSWFAIKQVDKFELSRHKNGVEMIMAELKAWKQVGTHKYVSDLHFAFQDRGYCYFVTSLLVGADLRYYIKMKIMLTEPEIAFIAGCMISALQHIHSKGVLHRDVKVCAAITRILFSRRTIH